MKWMFRALCGGLLFGGLVACIPSLHPLYTDDDLVFDPALVGQWIPADNADQSLWEFSKSGEKQYAFTLTEKDGKGGKFIVHLVQLGDRRFLDFFPVKPELAGRDDFYKNHLIPAHTFMQVLEIDPALKIRWMDQEWLSKYLKENPKAVAHERLEDDRIVFTADPKALQAFVLKNLETPGAFSDPYVLKRKGEASSP
jgi:hypothetical protein